MRQPQNMIIVFGVLITWILIAVVGPQFGALSPPLENENVTIGFVNEAQTAAQFSIPSSVMVVDTNWSGSLIPAKMFSETYNRPVQKDTTVKTVAVDTVGGTQLSSVGM